MKIGMKGIHAKIIGTESLATRMDRLLQCSSLKIIWTVSSQIPLVT